jgi:predicted nucleotide-binding protein (sugar kinase/HSP70/actin superfamily)
MWTVFFESLGARVVFSKTTSKETLDNGLSLSVDESCLPAKVFLGHVGDLVSKHPDFIFVCRQQDFGRNEALCTKLWGVPDICRNTFDLPAGCRWLELNISPAIDGITAFKAWWKVGRVLTRNPWRILLAYLKACRAQHCYERWLQAGKSPMEAIELVRGGAGHPQKFPSAVQVESGNGKVRIAVLGHSYLIHDEHFGRPVLKLLKKLGADVHVAEQLDRHHCRSVGREVSPSLYWTYNSEIVGAAEHYLQDGVDGAILVEAFPCGPDSLALELATRKFRGRAPVMRLVLDELQALTGLQTRLESFVDVLQMRQLEAANAC